MTNTELLIEVIKRSGLKYKYIAEKLNITYYGLQKKIHNKTEFKASEIATLCNILPIKGAKEKDRIFFAKDVD